MQKLAPKCQDTVELGEACCYKDGVPFPPPPPPGGPIPITEVLYPEVVKGYRSNDCLIRPFNPYNDLWKATVVLCVHVDNLSWQQEEMVAWIEHHRRIGVTKIALYLESASQGVWPDPGTQAYLQEQERSEFVEIHTLIDDSERHVQDAMQRTCIRSFIDKYAFITFLKLGEFLLLHAPTETAADLPALLSEPNLRYSSGVVLPLYHFAASETSRLERPSLAQAHTCWQGDLGLTRTIANTFWLLEAYDLTQFRFNGDLLPVTDAGVQWPAAARRWPLPGVHTPLEWHAHHPVPVGADLPDPMVGMGSRLRVVAPNVPERLTFWQSLLSTRRVRRPSTGQSHLVDVCNDIADASRLLRDAREATAR